MTTEICKHCNGWRGLHKWDTMQCPYMGYENEMWQETTYEEADETAAATIAAQSARIAELEAQVKSLTQTLDLIMEVHPTKNKDDYPFIVRQLVQMNRTRALLETK